MVSMTYTEDQPKEAMTRILRWDPFATGLGVLLVAACGVLGYETAAHGPDYCNRVEGKRREILDGFANNAPRVWFAVTDKDRAVAEHTMLLVFADRGVFAHKCLPPGPERIRRTPKGMSNVHIAWEVFLDDIERARHKGK
jgi:hypothetical protein